MTDLRIEQIGDVVRITPVSEQGAAFLVANGPMESGAPLVLDKPSARRVEMKAKAQGLKTQ